MDFSKPKKEPHEIKVLGPLNVRQFLFVLAGMLFAFVAYGVTDFGFFTVLVVLDVLVVGVLAFVAPRSRKM